MTGSSSEISLIHEKKMRSSTCKIAAEKEDQSFPTVDEEAMGDLFPKRERFICLNAL